MTPQALVGQTIADGRYRIVRLIGKGAMGAVYEAKQLAMDRLVALKVIRAEMAMSPGAAARFQQEMRVSARVEHPNTIRVYDFGEDQGQLYLAMELLAGRALGAVIEAEGRIAPERIVRIGRQVANALGAAHERGIVHRDLKPDNIMLVESFGEPDFVKVLDFGIAKSLDDNNPKLTATGSLIGTPAYMAPEQALGQPVDARADLYALGVVLYEMVCGRVPFAAPTLGSLLMAHATQPPPPLEEGPMPLRQLIAQLLEKLPADRPQTAAEVASRLEGSLHGDTVVARPRPARKRKLWPWAVAGFIVAGGATAAVLAMRSGEGCGPLVERARESVALADADEATRRCPDLAEAHNVRGNALQKLGRLDDAAAAYDRALALDPGLDASRFNLGLVKLRRKDASAADIFTDLLRRRPDYPDARLARAQAYLLAGRASDALTDLEEAVRQKPDDPAAKAALDELRKKLGR